MGLYGLVAGERNANFGMFAAGTLLTAIPTVVLFFSLQQYIVGGLTVRRRQGLTVPVAGRRPTSLTNADRHRTVHEGEAADFARARS